MSKDKYLSTDTDVNILLFKATTKLEVQYLRTPITDLYFLRDHLNKVACGQNLLKKANSASREGYSVSRFRNSLFIYANRYANDFRICCSIPVSAKSALSLRFCRYIRWYVMAWWLFAKQLCYNHCQDGHNYGQVIQIMLLVSIVLIDIEDTEGMFDKKIT